MMELHLTEKKRVVQLLAENNIEVLEWPGNSPDLINLIENSLHILKNKVAEPAD